MVRVRSCSGDSLSSSPESVVGLDLPRCEFTVVRGFAVLARECIEGHAGARMALLVSRGPLLGAHDLKT
jgi:hypothetical protein